MKVKLFFTGIFCLFFLFGESQNSLYNPNITPMPVECWQLNFSDFGSSPNIYKHFSCFELPNNGTINLTGSREVELVAGKEIHLKPGFSVSNLSSNGNFHGVIQKEEVGVAVFAPQTNLGEVSKCEMLELGLNLPDEITDQIENYFNNHGDLNPFDPEKISIEAAFIYYNFNTLPYYEQYLLPQSILNTAYIRQSFGFYYEEFHTDYSNLAYPHGDWIKDTTSFNFRIRFSPNKVGVWRTEIKIFINGILEYALKPIYFKCIPSDCPGFIVGGQTTSDKRHFVFENGDAFFGIGQNIAWPDLKANNVIMPAGLSPSRSQPPLGYDSLRIYINDLDANGGNLIRYMNGEWTDALERDKLLDYKEALPFAWEFDRTFDLLASNNMYILWALETHASFYEHNPYGSDILAWPGNPYNFEMGLPSIESFFTDPNAWMTYKKKIRYMMARWGYSTQIAGIQLINEMNRLGDDHTQDPKTEPYLNDSVFRGKVDNWFYYMKNYIQDELKYNFNIGTSYALALGPFWDESVAMKNADFNDWHAYDYSRNRNLKLRWEDLNDIDNSGYNIYDENKKPFIIGENGLLGHSVLYECKENDWHVDLWASSMMGGLATGLPWFLWKGEHNTRENFNGVSALFNQFIDFKNIEWTPRRWPELSNAINSTFYEESEDNYFEVLYMTGQDDFLNENRAFGWVHNRSSYWYNKKESCEVDLMELANTNSDTDDDLPAPSDDDNILQENHNFSENRVIRLDNLSNFQQYDIDWYDPKNFTYITTTHPTEYLFGKLKVIIPSAINNTEYKDLVFLLKPQGSTFLNIQINEYENTLTNLEKFTNSTNNLDTAIFLNLIVYPNPTDGIIKLKCSEMILRIELYDISGKLITILNKQELQTSIDLNGYSNGTYMLKVCGSKNIFYKKITLN